MIQAKTPRVEILQVKRDILFQYKDVKIGINNEVSNIRSIGRTNELFGSAKLCF